MKKFVNLFIAAMVMCAGVGLTSCGEGSEGEDVITPVEKPEEKIETGHYTLDFDDIVVYCWPESKEKIDKDYEAYKQSVTEALKLNMSKEIKWSEIEAEKERVQKAFDGLKGFEYEVRAAFNIVKYPYGITLKAYKNGKSEAAIDFGKKDITCVKKMPEGTSQLYMVIESAEAAAPSTKEYCQKVRKLYADALKEVLPDAFEEVQGEKGMLNFYNLSNVAGDREELVEKLKKVCDVTVPTFTDEMMQKALEEFPKMHHVMMIELTSYDPFAPAPARSGKEICSRWIGELR